MEPEDELEDLEASLPCPDWSDDDEALAYYLATARYGGRSLPVSVREEMERITLAAREDEALARRIRALSSRMDELDGGCGSEYERLSEGERVSDGPAARADRLPSAHRRGSSAPRRMAIGALIALILGCAGIVFSMRPQFADLAEPGIFLAVPPGPLVLRGESRAYESAREDLSRAHALLLKARGRGPAWFVRYDDTTLAEAMSMLEQIRASSDRGEPIHAAAAYLLAKAHLANEDPSAARAMLHEAADASGPAAAAARELSIRLDDRLRE